MKFDPKILSQCENLISKGDTHFAIEKLQSIEDSTGYKSEIINLANRWKSYNRNKLSGTLSSEAESLQNSKLNKDTLLLIEALERELKGEKIVSDLFQNKNSGNTWRPLTQTYIPILLTALAIWAISYFAYNKTGCEHDLNLNGNWEIFSSFDKEHQKVGRANIIQDPCKKYFQLSGELKSSSDPNKDVDFSASIAGFNDGKIIFVFENFEGETGVCRGIEPASSTDEFTVHCTDLVGFDKDGSTKGVLKFQRRKK